MTSELDKEIFEKVKSGLKNVIETKRNKKKEEEEKEERGRQEEQEREKKEKDDIKAAKMRLIELAEDLGLFEKAIWVDPKDPSGIYFGLKRDGKDLSFYVLNPEIRYFPGVSDAVRATAVERIYNIEEVKIISARLNWIAENGIVPVITA